MDNGTIHFQYVKVQTFLDKIGYYDYFHILALFEIMLHCVCFAVSHCPQLLPEFIYHCTDEFEDGSKCHLICREGYDVHPGLARVILCQNKKWRGQLPDCIGKLYI